MKHSLLPFAFLILYQLSLSAQIDVSGQVRDTDGSTLAGVNVIEIGTFNGTFTDADGNYDLSRRCCINK